MKHILLPGAACMALALPCFGQIPPPNDNFANRTVLAGNSVAFSGTLAGATIEPDEALGGDFTNYFNDLMNQSVWWTWTAPQTSLVTVAVTGASADSASAGEALDGLAIYDTTNIFTQAQPITETFLDLSILCDDITFSAAKGSNYQIQLLGHTSTAYRFLLAATDRPVILQTPQSQTVSSNACALFTVVTEGYRPLSYQWQFAGSNLPGQTAPMLALTNIDGSQAGSYSVAVSNVGGIVTSAPAMLTVSSSNIAPDLTAVSGGSSPFVFSLVGELGRNYRIESSVDLVAWTNESSFSRHIYGSLRTGEDYDSPALTSVVFNTNGSSTFGISSAVPSKFLRASQYHPANELCINNLRQIRFGKALWQRDTGSPRWYTPFGTDIAPYFVQGKLPSCPLDTNSSWVTSYSTASANCATTPGCSIDYTGHVLEEPQ